MIKYSYVLFFFLIELSCNSQNLIPNTSFEKNYGVPNCMNRFDLVKDWYNASTNTPDYLHVNAPPYGSPAVCDGNDISSVNASDNWLGSQIPRTGQAYAAIHLYVSYTHAREYIGVELIEPLCIGQEYIFEAYVSACDYNPYYSNMSFLFSEEKVFEVFEIEREPSFSMPHAVQETDSWVQFKYSFIADKPYKYLTLGNFYSYSDDRFELDGPYVIKDKYLSSYYIDDVSLTPIESNKPNLGADREVCSNSIISLDASVNASSYLWSTGDTTRTIEVFEGGNYNVCVKNCHAYLCDSVFIQQLHVPEINIGTDTSLCTDSINILLQVDSIYNVSWNDKSTSHSFLIQDYGEYWIKAIGDNGCYTTDTLKVLSSCPDCLSNANVFPNPAVGSADILFTSNDSYLAVIMVYSNLGQLVILGNIEVKTGVNRVSLDFDRLMSGIYQIDIRTSCGNIVLPVMILSD